MERPFGQALLTDDGQVLTNLFAGWMIFSRRPGCSGPIPNLHGSETSTEPARVGDKYRTSPDQQPAPDTP